MDEINDDQRAAFASERARTAWQLLQAYESATADIDDIVAADSTEPDLMSGNLPFEGDIADSLRQIFQAVTAEPRSTKIGKPPALLLQSSSPYQSYVSGLALRLAVLDKLGLFTGYHIRLLAGSGSVDALTVANQLERQLTFVNNLIPPVAAGLSSAMPLLITGEAAPTLADMRKLRGDLMKEEFPQGDVVEEGKVPLVYNSCAPLLRLPSLAGLLYDSTGAFDSFLTDWTTAYGVMATAWSPFRATVAADTKTYSPGAKALASKEQHKSHFANLVASPPGSPKPTAGYDPVFMLDKQYVATRADAEASLANKLAAEIDVTDLGIQGVLGRMSLNDALSSANRRLKQTSTLSLTVPVSHTRLIRLTSKSRRVKTKDKVVVAEVDSRVLPPAKEASARVSVQSDDFADVSMSTVLLAQAIMAYGYKTYPTKPGDAPVAVVATPLAVSDSVTFAPLTEVTRPSLRAALPGLDAPAGVDAYVTSYFYFPLTLVKEAAVAADLNALSLAHSPTNMADVRTLARALPPGAKR
jgi:hypothetical protein